MVSPSLIFRGQGRDVHPQLLVSQKHMQELRLDNQLRTSILFLVIRKCAHLDTRVHSLLKVGFSPLRPETDWCWSTQKIFSPLVELYFHNGGWTKKTKRIVSPSHRNEREGEEKKKRREKKQKALTHACPLCRWHHDERRGHHPGAGPSKGSQRCDLVQKKKWIPQRSHGSKKTKAWDDNSAQQWSTLLSDTWAEAVVNFTEFDAGGWTWEGLQTKN